MPPQESESRMRRSEVISQCLLNSFMTRSLRAGEEIVRRTFAEEFEGQDFSQWNAPIPDKTGRAIIRGVGSAMRIDVKRFIADLGEELMQDSIDQEAVDGEDALEQLRADAGWNRIEGDRFSGRP